MRVSKQTVAAELERFREEIQMKVRKVTTGKADGATTDCSVCAASFGASGMGRAQQRANYFAEKDRKEARQAVLPVNGKRAASESQRQFAIDLGAKLPKKCSMADAAHTISQAVKKRNERKAKKKLKWRKGRS